ncbi:hypothetical protein A7X83_06130 [Stenotrophomonas maltophilia]|uniref:Uncharacterized protein n=1 Tax=Stenotrophomonas maltophilia TaxID=40324 RepID=A0A2W6J382_STEMA|nr:hypothetical protein A7X83_06130 [Stenotrophomonas maltophilia]
MANARIFLFNRLLLIDNRVDDGLKHLYWFRCQALGRILILFGRHRRRNQVLHGLGLGNIHHLWCQVLRFTDRLWLFRIIQEPIEQRRIGLIRNDGHHRSRRSHWLGCGLGLGGRIRLEEIKEVVCHGRRTDRAMARRCASTVDELRRARSWRLMW